MRAHRAGLSLCVSVAACAVALGAERVRITVGAPWLERVGQSEVLRSSVRDLLRVQERQVLPVVGAGASAQRFATLGDSCAALVNLHRLSSEARFREQARRIGDHLIAWNDHLVAHRNPAQPYLGWGPETRKGYFGCPTMSGHSADDLWETAAALRCLLKLAEIDVERTRSRYFLRARDILRAWPHTDHRADGPYGAAGLRFYRKSTLPCEKRYVKNTNIALGEQLLRLHRLAPDAEVLRGGLMVLGSELWDVLTHRNLAYASYMTYLDRSAPAFAEQAAHNDRKVVPLSVGRPGEGLRCGAQDVSCWNHLAYEGYVLGNVHELLLALPPRSFLVASTLADTVAAIEAIMAAYRTSEFGSAARFDFAAAAEGTLSATHITAYNCALRVRFGPIYASECEHALRALHPRGGTILYGLVPDALLGP